MKLLIVENDHELLNRIASFMSREHFVCETAGTFAEGVRKVNNFDYDCVVLNPLLPDADGIRLVKLLREGAGTTGIIIISAKTDVIDRVMGLDSGADDYLVKPFELTELLARLKALMRRRTNHLSKELQFGGLTIFPDERCVIAGGQPLELTRKEYDILLYLVRHRNRIVTKEILAEHLWGDHMEDAENFEFIYTHVKNLRKKLTDRGFGALLKTVYGIGYKFMTV